MLQVCIDVRKVFDSGIGVVIRSLLAEFQKDGLSVSAICNGDDQRQRLQALFPQLNCSVARAANYSVKEQFAIPMVARGHLLWSPHYNVPCAVGCPVVSTVHDLLPLAYPQLFPGFAKQLYARLMFRLCVLKSAAVICVSEFTARELSKFTGCPARKIRVVHNGVAPRWFELKRATDPADPFFLFVGNLKPHKNLNLLLAAFETVSSRIPHRLVVVGESEGFITSDRTAADRAGRTPRVTFAGPVSDERLDELMSKASALIVPSVYEGFGLPALESLAAGVPVVVSDIPPLKEICGEVATYFDSTSTEALAEALIAVNCVRREQEVDIVQRGKARARDFSWERAGRSYRDVFAHTAGLSF